MDGHGAVITQNTGKAGKKDEPKLIVELVSSDGISYHLEQECAVLSPTLRMILESPGENWEQKNNKIVLHNMRSAILDCVCGYLRFQQEVKTTGDTSRQFYVNPKLSIELMMAADYLNI